ncbi:PREDICTED: probable G-protein coupled receptor 123 [Condylura cristata]|uniref:probable G-protein coupled receptor 123 n=1 Tax=Condylura cristata TaxID=143302 RepID=UPI0006429A2F|nr:PREDICTED: probable G-protein coupled receptor 123 [Condylura cristata]
MATGPGGARRRPRTGIDWTRVALCRESSRAAELALPLACRSRPARTSTGHQEVTPPRHGNALPRQVERGREAVGLRSDRKGRPVPPLGPSWRPGEWDLQLPTEGRGLDRPRPAPRAPPAAAAGSPQVGVALHYCTLCTLLWIAVAARDVYQQVARKAPPGPGAGQPPAPRQPLLRRPAHRPAAGPGHRGPPCRALGTPPAASSAAPLRQLWPPCHSSREPRPGLATPRGPHLCSLRRGRVWCEAWALRFPGQHLGLLEMAGHRSSAPGPPVLPGGAAPLVTTVVC